MRIRKQKGPTQIPSLKGACGNGCPVIRFQRTQLMEMLYETPPEPDSKPTTLLKAVLPAKFSKDTTTVMMREAKTE